jgi:hypothetical protein
MEPLNIRFGGGAAEMLLHPLVAAAMLVAIAVILLLPRKYVIVPLLLAAFSIPLGQVVVVGWSPHPGAVLAITIAARGGLFGSGARDLGSKSKYRRRRCERPTLRFDLQAVPI